MIAVAAAAAFLATFNETFLNVAFTPIMQDFNVDVNTVQWLTTGYLLVAAVFVPVSNFLYHRFSTGPLFVAVVALMVVGSVVGAFAPTFEVLLLARLDRTIYGAVSWTEPGRDWHSSAAQHDMAVLAQTYTVAIR